MKRAKIVALLATFGIGGMAFGLTAIANPVRRMEWLLGIRLPSQYKLIETFGGGFPEESFTVALEITQQGADRLASEPGVRAMPDVDLEQAVWLVHLSEDYRRSRRMRVCKEMFNDDQSSRSVIIFDGERPLILLHWGSSH
jgi:hypothetical protein